MRLSDPGVQCWHHFNNVNEQDSFGDQVLTRKDGYLDCLSLTMLTKAYWLIERTNEQEEKFDMNAHLINLHAIVGPGCNFIYQQK